MCRGEYLRWSGKHLFKEKRIAGQRLRKKRSKQSSGGIKKKKTLKYSIFSKNKKQPFRASLSFFKSCFPIWVFLKGCNDNNRNPKPKPHRFHCSRVPLRRSIPTPLKKFSPGSAEKLYSFSPPPPSKPNSKLKPRVGLEIGGGEYDSARCSRGRTADATTHYYYY